MDHIASDNFVCVGLAE